MKKILLLTLMVAPAMLFAAEHANVETDILERTVNFVIFLAIVYYLLADKIKVYLGSRTESIQAELDKVQATLEESKKKVADAQAELENAKKLAEELVVDAKSNVADIQNKIEATYQSEMKNINKLFDEKIELETKKAKKETVKEVLEVLLSKDNLSISKENLSEIISRKVA